MVGFYEATVFARDAGLHHGVAVSGETDVKRRVAKAGAQLASPSGEAVVEFVVVVGLNEAVGPKRWVRDWCSAMKLLEFSQERVKVLEPKRPEQSTKAWVICHALHKLRHARVGHCSLFRRFHLEAFFDFVGGSDRVLA